MHTIRTTFILLPLLAAGFFACDGDNGRADAYGNFEAEEVIVSAEANGKLLQFELEEGQMLAEGQQVGLIDTTQLYLKKKQLQATIIAIGTRKQDIQVQARVYEEQKQNLLREKKRVEKLLADGAATPKQLDDINGQIDVVESQMAAHITSLATTNRSLESEVAPLQAQIDQIEDQLARAVVRNPIKGRVLAKYAEAHEVTAFGKPLYKIADLDQMILRVYVSGNQLPDVKVGNPVSVRIDNGQDGLREMEGRISWVAEEAEFTPKVIQTREERVNLVYAVKVEVPNDGSLKIGMPGEVMLQGSASEPQQAASYQPETE